MNNIEDKIKRHDEMIRKHDEEISELKEIGKMHEERIARLENLSVRSEALMEKLTDGMVQMAKSQNRMIAKIVGVVVSLVAVIGLMVHLL